MCYSHITAEVLKTHTIDHCLVKPGSESSLKCTQIYATDNILRKKNWQDKGFLLEHNLRQNLMVD